MLASVRDGRETREYFGGGSSASPMGVIWNEHDLTIYGSIARMPLSLRLRKLSSDKPVPDLGLP